MISADPHADLAAPALILSPSSGGRVRQLEAADLPRVAALFLKTFRPRMNAVLARRAVDEVADYMRQIYLDGPCSDEGINPLVHVGPQGDIGGFLGFIKSHYLLDGQPLRACVTSALMASDDGAHRRAGPQLMRALTNSAFDLFVTDSANRTSFAFARPMKYEVSLLHSLEWSRPFRPAALLIDMVRQRWPLVPTALLSPVAGMADAAATRMLRARRRRAAPRRWREEDIDAATFASHAPGFLADFRLRPAWMARELDWLLAKAGQQCTNGPLRFRLVTDNAGTPLGCFAFYGAAGRQATVLQILAREGHWDSVVDCMMQATEALGCIGVHGAGHAKLMPHLYAYPDLFFYHAGATMAFSRHPDVVAAVRTDAALLGGLAGDRWTRLSKGQFGLAPQAAMTP